MPTVLETSIRRWLMSLGALCQITTTPDEARHRIAAFAPMLAAEYPIEAFTQASLAHVAKHCTRGFPPYGELCSLLTAWWRDNRTKPTGLPSPAKPPDQRPAPTPDEIAYVRNLVANLRAELGTNDPPRPSQQPTPRHLTPEQLDHINPLPDGRKRAGPP